MSKAEGKITVNFTFGEPKKHSQRYDEDGNKAVLRAVYVSYAALKEAFDVVPGKLKVTIEKG